jgi:CRP-like cAMP-binding protein
VLFHESDPAEFLYILEDGEVDIVTELPDGTQCVVDTLIARDVLCWSALVEPHETTAAAIAHQPSRLLAIDAVHLRALCAKDHTLGYHLMTEVARVLRERLKSSQIQLATAS